MKNGKVVRGGYSAELFASAAGHLSISESRFYLRAALRPCQPSASCPRHFSSSYFSVLFNILKYFSVFFSIFQNFSVFFSIFSISTCCAIRPCQPSASILDGIQRLYHHHCWSIFLNHQIVKGDIWASFWDSLGMWEGCKIWTLYMFTSSFLFRKKSDSRVPLVGPQWCSEEVDPAWRLCLFYVLIYYMRSLLHVFYITYMFCCGFCSNRILLYFPMCVCQCVSHRRDI